MIAAQKSPANKRPVRRPSELERSALIAITELCSRKDGDLALGLAAHLDQKTPDRAGAKALLLRERRFYAELRQRLAARAADRPGARR